MDNQTQLLNGAEARELVAEVQNDLHRIRTAIGPLIPKSVASEFAVKLDEALDVLKDTLFESEDVVEPRAQQMSSQNPAAQAAAAYRSTLADQYSRELSKEDQAAADRMSQR